MANLSDTQIKELFEVPKNRTQIDAAIKQHNRLRFHVHPAQSIAEVSPAYYDFIAWVRELLPAAKYKDFIKLLGLPVPTVDLTDEIFSELKRAIEGENGFVKFDFTNESLEDDFNAYRQQITEEAVWRNEGFETFKTEINNIVIVDLPGLQKGERPEPYFYFLEPELLYDVDINYKGIIEYVIFNEGDLTRYVFDDTYYRVYTREQPEDSFKLAVEVAHSTYTPDGTKVSGLGYCPARLFWDIPQSKPEVLQRKGPLTPVLSRLDKLVFWDTATEYYQTYATYPIYWEYANDCDYHDENGNACEDGFVKGTSSNNVRLDPLPCPRCTANKYIGPGSIKRVEAPADNSDADLREPAGIIKVDVEALKNAQESLEGRKQAVFKTCVGAGGEPKNDQAKNEKQVKSDFESRQNVLLAVKQSFERVRKWVLDTVCTLRYGDAFTGSTVNYGDEFYLVNEAELAEAYRLDKEAGLPAYYLSKGLETLLQTKFKNNPDMVQRMNILSHLEPYPEHTINDLRETEQLLPGTVNPDLFILKLNFSAYIKRFEAEELDILRFGANTDLQLKVSSIQQKLLTYVAEDRKIAGAWADSRRPEPNTVPPNAGGSNGNGGGKQPARNTGARKAPSTR